MFLILLLAKLLEHDVQIIQKITTDALQKQTFVLPDGTKIVTTIAFIPMQYGWFIRDMSYADFELKNIRITNSPNMLHQFRNQIPFGIACISTNDREPSQQQDFSSAASILYILTADEVNQYTEFLSGKI